MAPGRTRVPPRRRRAAPASAPPDERSGFWQVAGGRLRAVWARLSPPDGPPLIRPSEVGVDRVLVGTVLMLLGFGIVMVFSSGAVFAAKRYGDSTYFLKRELIYAVLGLGALSLAMRVDYAHYRRAAYPLLFAALIALAVVLKMGTRVGGATSATRSPSR
jgi:hypothetical protein